MSSKDKQRPLISFIITNHNISPDLLKKCIASIIDLSLRKEEREIILVDDGSEKSPLDKLSEYLQDIIYIRQANGGLSSARNTGLRFSMGQFIQFIDGDDYLLRAQYEHCLDIVRYHHPDIVLFMLTDKADVKIPFEFKKPINGSRYMRNNNLRASACSYIFAKSILGNLRFPEDISMHEDEFFTPLLFLRSEQLYETNAQAYFYRKRQGSIMSDRTKSHISKRLDNLEQVIMRLQATLDSMPDTDKPALNRRIAQLSMDYLYNTIKLTHNRKTLQESIDKLSSHGLFPLPDKEYTLKYKYFRKAIDNKFLRNIITLICPI